MDDTFNPLDWIESDPKRVSSNQSQCAVSRSAQSFPTRRINNPSVPCATADKQSISSEVDTVVARIEADLTDITTTYQDWLNVGFALANEFGEGGRGFFHRVSRFYNGYTKTNTDKQFDQCLKSTPSSRCITIKTFFYLAKQAGIDVNTNETKLESNTVYIAPPAPEPPELPTLPDAIFPLLPEFLQRVVKAAVSKEERDILLLGALGVLSAVFPKLSGTYDDRKVFSNLYLFITAPAAAGKGRLSFCKQLIMPIHRELRKESDRLHEVFNMEMGEYNIAKLKDPNAVKPIKPPELMFIIPANCSASGMFQLLSDNENRGLIFEPEGDTLTLAFKSDYGNYSEGYRKGYHHETISLFRRTDREYREIICPCISSVLSGTPKQVASLIPDAENGLFSRFIFYYMNIRPVWKNVFAKPSGKGLEEHFDDLGQEVFTLHKALKEQPDMKFCLTQEQENRFHVFFSQIQDRYLTFHGMDYMGTIRRMGLIAFRIAMIFTGLRIMETGDFSQKQVCLDDDFQSALEMVRVLIRHSSHVFSELPEEVKRNRPMDRKELFLDKLPEKFTKKEFMELAKSMNIRPRTAERYISIFCENEFIRRDQLGQYTNLTNINDQ